MNLAAVREMRRAFPTSDVVLIESGGDNLTATFSPELADLTLYVIDRFGRDKIPRKGGPGITRSDLLVITDRPCAHGRRKPRNHGPRRAQDEGERPFLFANIRAGAGLRRSRLYRTHRRIDCGCRADARTLIAQFSGSGAFNGQLPDDCAKRSVLPES